MNAGQTTQFGFVWGPMEVERVASDDGWGVMIEVKTTCGQRVEIRATPSGRLRVHVAAGNVKVTRKDEP